MKNARAHWLIIPVNLESFILQKFTLKLLNFACNHFIIINNVSHQPPNNTTGTVNARDAKIKRAIFDRGELIHKNTNEQCEPN